MASAIVYLPGGKHSLPLGAREIKHAPRLKTGPRGLTLGTVHTRAVVAFVAVACASWLACRSTARPTSAPAVVMVSIDTLRPDHLGCYGYARPISPRIDAFRREAVLMRDAVASAPSTLASHASMFTSLLVQHHGASVALQSALRPGLVTLAEVLQGAGFATASFNGGGELHRVWGLDRGFGVYVSATDSSVTKIGDDTLAGQVRLAKPWLERVGPRPFFLFLHTYEVHHPYTPAPERLRALEPSYSGRLPDRISIRLLEKINSGRKKLAPGDLEHIVAAYDAEIASADAGFGDLVDLLKRRGRYDSAIVVLISDHGEAFGERGKVGWHGDALYDEQIRIPLLVKLPGGQLAGKTIEPQVRAIDLAPSLLSLLGLPSPPQFSGTRIDFAGGAPDHPPWSLSTIDGALRIAAVRTRRWKWYEGRLYDLEHDPGETRDVASLHPEVERDLQDRLVAIRRSREAAGTTPVGMPDEVQDQLKALGYLE
jgi:arylsulfatase A-like enzyme